MRKKRKSILLVGGGSGGHLLPGIALAQELQKRLPAWCISFVVSEKAIDRKIIETSNFSWVACPIVPLPKEKSFYKYLLFVIKFAQSWWFSEKCIRRSRPQLLVGLGSYVCFPAGVLAKLHKIPTVYLESNICAGKVVRWLSPWSQAVFCSLECSGIEQKKIVDLGLPIRREISQIKKQNVNVFTVLVIGGSQGSVKMNKVVMDSLSHLQASGKKIKFIHIVGNKENQESCEKLYTQYGFANEVYDYFPSIEKLYSKAHLVISQSGGSTVAELMVLGLPSILVPFGRASENHQYKNAEYLKKRGAALLLEEKHVCGAKLSVAILHIVTQEKVYQNMVIAAKSIGKPQACQEIADYIIENILGIVL